jgi:hypothetical protein
VPFLNAKNMLIRDELMSEGSISEAAMYARDLIRRAIDPHASCLLLVHNHPSAPRRARISPSLEISSKQASAFAFRFTTTSSWARKATTACTQQVCCRNRPGGRSSWN